MLELLYWGNSNKSPQQTLCELNWVNNKKRHFITCHTNLYWDSSEQQIVLFFFCFFLLLRTNSFGTKAVFIMRVLCTYMYCKLGCLFNLEASMTGWLRGLIFLIHEVSHTPLWVLFRSFVRKLQSTCAWLMSFLLCLEFAHYRGRAEKPKSKNKKSKPFDKILGSYGAYALPALIGWIT